MTRKQWIQDNIANIVLALALLGIIIALAQGYANLKQIKTLERNYFSQELKLDNCRQSLGDYRYELR